MLRAQLDGEMKGGEAGEDDVFMYFYRRNC